MRAINKQTQLLLLFSYSNIVKLSSIVQTGYSDTYRFLDNLLYPLRWLGSSLNWFFESLVAGTVILFGMILNEFYKFGVAFLKTSYIVTYRIGSIMESYPYKEEIDLHYKNQRNIEDAMKHLKSPFNLLGSFIVSLQKLISNLTGFVLVSVYSLALHILTIPGTALYLSAVLIKGITQAIASGIISGYKLCANMISALVKPDTRTSLHKTRQGKRSGKHVVVEESNLSEYEPFQHEINLLDLNLQGDTIDALYDWVEDRFLNGLKDRLFRFNSALPDEDKLTFSLDSEGNPDTSPAGTTKVLKFLKNPSLVQIRRNAAKKWIDGDLLPLIKTATDKEVIESVCTAIIKVGKCIEDQLGELANHRSSSGQKTFFVESIISAHGGNTNAPYTRESLYQWCTGLLDVVNEANDDTITYQAMPMPDQEDQGDNEQLSSEELRRTILSQLIDILWVDKIIQFAQNRQYSASETMSQTYSPSVSGVGTPVRANQLQVQSASASNQDNQHGYAGSGSLKSGGWLSTAASALGWNKEQEESRYIPN